jgi:target of EGR1 protein 1
VILDEEARETLTTSSSKKRKKKRRAMKANINQDLNSNANQNGDLDEGEEDDDEENDEAVSPSTCQQSPATPAKSASAKKHNSSHLFETYHSAHFDAYMTGYIFLHQCVSYKNLIVSEKNKMYLMGKQMPLLIKGSKFVKCSAGHREKRRRWGF